MIASGGTGAPTPAPGALGPDELQARFEQALALHRQGQLDPAEALYRTLLASAPAHAGALHLLGVIQQQRGDSQQAAQLIARSIALDPGLPAPHSNLGIALHRLQRPDEALASFERALQLKPEYVDAHVNRGHVLRALGRPDQALASYHAALSLRPESAEAQLQYGHTLLDLGRAPEALESFDRLLALDATSVPARVGRGNALRQLRRDADALASYERALQLKPGDLAALVGRGNCLLALQRQQEALACYDRALKQNPDLPGVQNNRGAALRDLKRYPEAAEAFARLAAARPDFDYVDSNCLHSKLSCCDWHDYDASVRSIRAQVMAGRPADVPFSFLAISDSAQEQRQCARESVRRHHPAASRSLAFGPVLRTGPRIHIAYLSADFHSHASACQMAELFERHDREQFRVSAISFGPSAPDPMRQRLIDGVDEFVDARRSSDLEAAQAIHAMGVDIAIDLKGFTTGNRAGILAHRPAPVQVSYLGYPGTMAAPYIDYLIADRVLIPERQQPFYSEQVVYLPDSYQFNDGRRATAGKPPTRSEAGLPETGFVFCCFSDNHKIAPPVFAVWMRLLAQVPGSVLWLLQDNADASRNLRSEANRRGIAPSRLVFAPRVPLEQHLARQQLAGLLLDTLPCNAQVAASDALWAGLPVLTCTGESFASRVAASLLTAAGLPELVCTDLAQYQALALRLASTPSLHSALREKLRANRLKSPLFDSDRFRRHLESAYRTMHQRQLRAQPPLSFAVPPIP